MLTHQCFTVIQISSKVEGSHRLCRIDGAYTMQNWRLNVTWVTCTCVVLIALRGTNKEDAGCWEEIGCRHARLLGWPRGVCNCSQHEGSCDFWVNSDVMMWASWPWLVSWGGELALSQVKRWTWPHGHLSEDGRGLQKEDRIQGAIHHWAQSSWANCASIRLRCPNGHWFLVSVGAL